MPTPSESSGSPAVDARATTTLLILTTGRIPDLVALELESVLSLVRDRRGAWRAAAPAARGAAPLLLWWEDAAPLAASRPCANCFGSWASELISSLALLSPVTPPV